MENQRFLTFGAFDKIAAIEYAELESSGLDKSKKRFDHQIFAIAKSRGIKTIYSNDADLKGIASRNGGEIKVENIKDIHTNDGPIFSSP